jgi:hypothetical protein
VTGDRTRELSRSYCGLCSRPVFALSARAATDLGVAPWVEALRTAAWVPTSAGLRTPAEVLLHEPAVAEQQATAHLLRASLPSDVSSALANPPLGPLLLWGSAPPPSPMQRFRALVEQARAAEQARTAAFAAAQPAPANGASPAPAAPAAAPPRVAAPGLAQVLATWRALAHAHAGADAEVDGAFVRASVASLALLPLGRTLVRSARAIARTPKPAGGSAAGASAGGGERGGGKGGVSGGSKGGGVSGGKGGSGESGESASAESVWADETLVDGLVGAGWLLDVATDAALREVARPLASLLELPRTPPSNTVLRWLQQLWRAPPPHIGASAAELACMRATFSLALYRSPGAQPAGALRRSARRLSLPMLRAAVSPCKHAPPWPL